MLTPAVRENLTRSDEATGEPPQSDLLSGCDLESSLKALTTPGLGGASISMLGLGVGLWAALGCLASVAVHVRARLHEQALPRGQTILQVGTTATLFAVLAWHGIEPELVMPSVLAVTAVPLALIDVRTQRLPNGLMFPTYVLIAGAGIIVAVWTETPAALLRSVAGALTLITLFGALYVLFPGEMGGGDVKIAGPLGAVLAWSGWSMLLTGVLLGWGIAAAFQLFTRAIGRGTRDTLPLGAFLIVGTFIAIVVVPAAAS